MNQIVRAFLRVAAALCLREHRAVEERVRRTWGYPLAENYGSRAGRAYLALTELLKAAP